jgi:phenylalanyl-tRNA synthetase beta chain
VRCWSSSAGARPGPVTDVDAAGRAAVRSRWTRPGRLAGRDYAPEVVRRRLEDVGCTVHGDDPLEVVPAVLAARPHRQAELIEEVLRLEGYDTIPVVLPTRPAGPRA